MITLTMQCSRCSKEVSSDMTDQILDNDLVRKFGFSYINSGKVNVLICNDCEKLFKDLQDKLHGLVKIELCGFFDNCEEGEENGDRGEPENGRGE